MMMLMMFGRVAVLTSAWLLLLVVAKADCSSSPSSSVVRPPFTTTASSPAFLAVAAATPYHFRGGGKEGRRQQQQLQQQQRRQRRQPPPTPTALATQPTTESPQQKQLPPILRRFRRGKEEEAEDEAAAAVVATVSDVPTDDAEVVPARRGNLVVPIVVSTLVAALAYYERQYWLPLLDKDRIQATTLQILEGLQPSDPNSWEQRVLAHVYYGLGMTVWEFIGLSTIPVETAAGMVFGWTAAFPSALGKLLGASTAFLVGRTWLRQVVVQRLASNPLCQLLQRTQQGPHARPGYVSALLMKYSCFPETMKNFGTAALLPAVSYGIFITSTIVHGVKFSLLWTWLGVDTARQLAATQTGVAAATDPGLQIALALMLFLGFVISPLLMAWWARDLKRAADSQNEKSSSSSQTVSAM